MLIFILAAALATAAPAAPATPAPPPVPFDKALVQKAIDEGNARYIQTWKRGDANGFAALFDDNADVVSDESPTLHGREAVRRARIDTFARVKMVNGAIKTTDLVLNGPLAYELGTYAFTLKVAGKEATEYKGRYLEIWTHEPDGSWKILMDAGLPERACAQ